MPSVEMVEFESMDIVCSSDQNKISMGTGTAPGIAESNQRGNAIWDD